MIYTILIIRTTESPEQTLDVIRFWKMKIFIMDKLGGELVKNRIDDLEMLWKMSLSKHFLFAEFE